MNRARPVGYALLVAVVAAFVCIGCGTAPASRTSTLTIVHVNDTHQHLFPFSSIEQPRARGGFARLATVVAAARAGASPVLLLHGGDTLVGSASTYLANGRPDYAEVPTYGWRGLDSIRAMNLLGFDAMAIGNHEMDYGKRWLDELKRRARFPFLSANLFNREVPDVDKTAGTPFAQPYIIVRKAGLRIGIIGLTTTEYTQSLQVQVRDPIAAARDLVPRVARQSDFLIVLSHLGLKPDLELAQAVPGIDLIVGGHSHTLLQEPVVVGGTIIVQAGAYAAQVGVLDLTITGGKIASHRYALKPLDESVPSDPTMDAELKSMLAVGSVGDRQLGGADEQGGGVAGLASSAMLAATGADAALMDPSTVTGRLGPGAPTLQQFFDVFWPYRRREQTPEKDMSERQLLTPVNVQLDPALRSLVRGSDGLRTLAVGRIAADAFTAWRAANERAGDDRVLVKLRDPAATRAAGAPATVVMPFDLALRAARLGLPIDPRTMELERTELFEAVLDFLARGGGGAAPTPR
jgi:5'-nucleotidase / UDP-sugar diphosphatase